MKKLLSNSVKMTLVQAGLADGQTDPNSSSVNMAGYDGVLFVGLIGTITGTGTCEIHAQQSSDDGVADGFTDLSSVTATASGSADSDKLLVLDVYQPPKQYVRVAMTRATDNSIVGGVLAIQYATKDKATATAAAQLAASVVQAVNPTE